MYRPIIGGAKCIVAPNQNFGGAMAHVVPTAAPPHGADIISIPIFKFRVLRPPLTLDQGLCSWTTPPKAALCLKVKVKVKN